MPANNVARHVDDNTDAKATLATPRENQNFRVITQSQADHTDREGSNLRSRLLHTPPPYTTWSFDFVSERMEIERDTQHRTPE